MLIKDRIPVCPHGKKEDINQVLVISLERLEHRLGYDLTFSSGYRCPACNAAAGGAKNSAHLRGLAVDALASSSADRYHLLCCAIEQDFARIGVGRNFIHLDIDLSLPQHVIWLY